MNKKENKDIPYKPSDASLNYTAMPQEPPKTEYEKRKKVLQRKEVKDLTRGKYGRTED